MSETTSDKPIRTPLAYRLRLMRHRTIPLIVWICVIAALLVMGRGDLRYINGVGVVEARQFAVSPAIDGIIQSLAVDILDTIEAGQILALMDDTIVAAELVVAEAEMSRIRMKVRAEGRRLDEEFAQKEADVLNDLRRFQINEENARLEYLDKVVRQESDTIKLERLRLDMNRQRDLVAQNIHAEELYDDTRLRYEALKTEIEQNETAISVAKTNLDRAVERRVDWESQVVDGDTVDFLGPIREALNVQEARINEIKQRRRMLALNAPVSGQVTHIFHRPGETVLAGDPIMAITDTSNQRVIAYVDERSAGKVIPGSEVHLQSENRPDRAVVAIVARAGAALEELPIVLRGTPILPEWGFPVLISQIPQGVFLPGERLRVSIKASGSE